jgi:hypothetical protein
MIGSKDPAVRQISFGIEGRTTAILRSHGLDTLGDLSPFAAEFWRSPMTALFRRVLEAPCPNKRMVFRHPVLVHRRSYERVFNCPIDFDADRMEWHFDATVLNLTCPNADHREGLPAGLRGDVERASGRLRPHAQDTHCVPQQPLPFPAPARLGRCAEAT